MSGNMTLDRCFKEAEETGRLNLSLKNLRDFPDPAEDCELIDVIEIGQFFRRCKNHVRVASAVISFLLYFARRLLNNF